MTASIGGASVLSASISMPLSGAWTAEVVVGSDQALSGRVVLDDGGVQFRGTVVNGEVDTGRSQALIVGGAGGLGTELEAKAYRATPARSVINDILAEAGETLSADADPALLGVLLPFWHRDSGPAWRALGLVVFDALGANWRVKRDGSIWIGRDVYAEQKLDHVVVGRDEASRMWEIASERSELLPGVTFQDRLVKRVIHKIDGGSQRTEVWFEDPVLGLRRQPGLGREQQLLRLYPSTVVAQHSDGSVDLLPDDVEVRGRGTQHVPVRWGLPGTRVELQGGHRVLLGFEAGDPTRPFATGWLQSGSLKLGTLLLIQNAQSMALLPPQWFTAGAAGDAAAAAARAAAAASGNIAYLVALSSPVMEVP